MLVETSPSSPDTPVRPEDPAEALADLAALALALTGNSAVDVARLWFTGRPAVDRYLRLNEFDTDSSIDLGRLQQLHREAITYLTDVHRYRLPRPVEQIEDIHDLFLWASDGPRRVQRFACMILKVMHIVHHLEARRLVFTSDISEAELAERTSQKVLRSIDAMRHAGVGVREFAAGQKTTESLVTKLIAKREVLASQIFDKLRFRIVVDNASEIVKTLRYLLRHLVPFNYVVPGQSQNGLLEPATIAAFLGLPIETVHAALGTPIDAKSGPGNEFSGPTFRSVNFVVDIPLRIDDKAPDRQPAIAFVQCEMQVVDTVTHGENNRGENAHTQYKKRQRDRVRRRLEPSGVVDLDEDP